jgi:hypothetical protein|tara:strand:- start:2350 stop:2982 length:633 start_codon:yes stop_codon:yes gene_type:complete
MLSAEKIEDIVGYILRVLIVVAIIGSTYTQRWMMVALASVILLMSFIPDLINKRTNIKIPEEFEFLFIIFIFAAVILGEVNGYYTIFWWWDMMLHLIAGFNLGLIGLTFLFILYKEEKIKASPIFIAIFAFSFAMALGALWEIFEFAGDQILGTNMLRSGLLDTMGDLIVDAIGALAASTLGYFYVKYRKGSIVKRFTKLFFKENPGLVK